MTILYNKKIRWHEVFLCPIGIYGEFGAMGFSGRV